MLDKLDRGRGSVVTSRGRGKFGGERRGGWLVSCCQLRDHKTMRHKTMRQLGRVGERYRIVQRGRIEWLRLDQGRKKLANSVELKVARPTRSTASYLPPASVVDFLPGQCFKRCGSLALSLAGGNFRFVNWRRLSFFGAFCNVKLTWPSVFRRNSIGTRGEEGNWKMEIYEFYSRHVVKDMAPKVSYPRLLATAQLSVASGHIQRNKTIIGGVTVSVSINTRRD